MLSTDQVIKNVAARIGWIYGRPLMYGGTAEGVELLLVSLHEIWAMCQQREDEYWQAFHELHGLASHGAMNCSTYFSRENPGASENETVAYYPGHYVVD